MLQAALELFAEQGFAATSTRELSERLGVLTQDPSVAHRPASASHAALEERMLQLLAGHEAPGLAERLRARAALAAIRGALLHVRPADDPAVVRATILAAACGALGIPAPVPAPTSRETT